MRAGRYIVFNEIAILFLALFIGTSACAAVEGTITANPEYYFYKGNSHYEEGKYDEAVSEYTKILKLGFESGSTYYNLGNAYFKKGEIGRAILNYERARRLIPNDRDLKANYSYAISRIKKGPSDIRFSLIQQFLGFFEVFTLNGTALFLSSLYSIIILLAIAMLFFKDSRRTFTVIMIVLAAIFTAGASSLYSRASLLNSEAIVVTGQPEVMFEPINNSTIFFNIYQGSKVQILQSKTGWKKIKRGDGKIGWVEEENLEAI